MQLIDPTAKISPLAVIEEGAVIGANVEIGAFCVKSNRTDLSH